MRRIAIWLVSAAAVLVAAAFAATQLLLPGAVEGRIEDRLTSRGGSADVSVEAVPALALLLGGRGDRLEVRGRDIAVGIGAGSGGTLDSLDRFGEVDVRLADLAAGPLDARTVTLERRGRDEPYRLRLDAAVIPAELLRFAGSQLGGPLGGLVGGLAAGAVPLAGQSVPVEIDATLRSDEGEVRLVSGDASVAGLPLGPLAEAVARAVAARI